jgi:glycosyltransferase involved in cell wall biosynthesis
VNKVHVLRVNSGISASPFLTIITRCYARPISLVNCLQSVERQSFQDFEHIFIIDEDGIGVRAANRLLFEYRDVPCGKYVYILDDDNYLVDDCLFEKMEVMGRAGHGVLLFKNIIGGVSSENIWTDGKLKYLSGNSYAIEKGIWHKHILAFDALPGNPAFNKEIDNGKYSMVRIDTIGASILREGKGKPEESAKATDVLPLLLDRYNDSELVNADSSDCEASND